MGKADEHRVSLDIPVGAPLLGMAVYGYVPNPEWLIEKYKTWDLVLEKAMSTNAAADAVLGLYEKYYDTYLA